MAVIFGIIGPKSQKAFGIQWRKVGRLNARVEESFSGHALVKVFGRETGLRATKFQAENEELYQASFKAQFLSGMIMPGMMFVGNLTYVGIAVLGGLMVAERPAAPRRRAGVHPVLAAVHPAAVASSAAWPRSCSRAPHRPSASSSCSTPTSRSRMPTDAPAPVDGDGVIEFENVQFSYTPERPLITDLSFRVEPGQTVAIVGPTGAGKTTLVNLIMRFYELDGGRILLDGQDIAELTPRRRALAHRHGAAGSVAVRRNDPREHPLRPASRRRMTRSSTRRKATRVDRFVHSLPDGYDTVLDEEASNVSAGEKQLITIARAFVAQPSVLILDEATSSVDTRTELLLQHAMAALREGRTSFVIAHRLSTIRDADLILVMEHGDIVEKGTHDELIARAGRVLAAVPVAVRAGRGRPRRGGRRARGTAGSDLRMRFP